MVALAVFAGSGGGCRRRRHGGRRGARAPGWSPRSPTRPSKVPGAGSDGVASGINPTGGNLSKEGIDAGPPKPRTSFRYGEDPNASGDKGRALIQRPGIPALITRPADTEAGGSEGATPSAAQPAGASVPGGSLTRAGAVQPSGPAAPPPSTGPSATGSPTPTSWVYPNQPPVQEARRRLGAHHAPVHERADRAAEGDQGWHCPAEAVHRRAAPAPTSTPFLPLASAW